MLNFAVAGTGNYYVELMMVWQGAPAVSVQQNILLAFQLCSTERQVRACQVQVTASTHLVVDAEF